MNRRGFISMLAGAAGALALPKWRIPDPVIILPGDFDTDNLLYKATERYSAGFTDWRGVYGNDGVALTSIEHPDSGILTFDRDINPGSLETIEIDVRAYRVVAEEVFDGNTGRLIRRYT